MGHVNRCLWGVLLISAVSFADVTTHLNVKTEDGTVSNYPYQIRLTNGSLMDNGDGTMSISIIASGGGAGYFVEPATVTFRLDLGATVSTLTVTGVTPSTTSFVVKDGLGTPVLWTDTTVATSTEAAFSVYASTSLGYLASLSTSTSGGYILQVTTQPVLNSQALCLLNNQLGHCTSVVGIGGDCTCVVP